MLNINISKQAEKFLKKIDAKIWKQIAQKIMALRLLPFPNDSQKLIWFDFYRVDSWEYRIVYLIKKDTIYIYVIWKRNDSEVYKILKRK